MYEVYLQYGHDSPEYQDLIREKEKAESEWRERKGGGRGRRFSNSGRGGDGERCVCVIITLHVQEKDWRVSNKVRFLWTLCTCLSHASHMLVTCSSLGRGCQSGG